MALAAVEPRNSSQVLDTVAPGDSMFTVPVQTNLPSQDSLSPRVLRQLGEYDLLECIGAGVERGPGAKPLPRIAVPEGPKDKPPYAHPYYWAGFVLVGDRD